MIRKSGTGFPNTIMRKLELVDASM